MEILQKITEAFVLGLIGGSVPGPILTSMFAEILRTNFFRSMRVVGRALVSEAIIATFILVIFSAVSPPEFIFRAISFAGVGVLFWLAWQVAQIREMAKGGKEIFTFSKIFMLTIFNGGFWIFWITICVPLAFLFRELIFGGHFIFLGSFEAGWLVSTIFWGFLFSRFRSVLVRPNFAPIVFRFLAFLLFAFGIKMLIESVNFFL